MYEDWERLRHPTSADYVAAFELCKEALRLLFEKRSRQPEEPYHEDHPAWPVYRDEL